MNSAYTPGDNMTRTIMWTLPMLKRFRAAHKDAVAAEHSGFNFEGNEFDVNYAKYLIQYLEGRLK